jgi:hypothetical protein
MILDSRNEFADATALSTAATGLALVGNVIDLGTDGINDVEDMYLVVQIDTAVTSAGSATVAFTLASDAQAAIAVDGSASVHTTTAAVAKASLVAGYTVCQISLPKGQYERYLGILQNVGTAALTAGKVNAFLTPNPVTAKAFSSPSQA